MGEGRDKQTSSKDSTAHKPPIHFADVYDHKKKDPKHDPKKDHLYLAQSQQPPQKQVTGIGTWGTVAPTAAEQIKKQAIARQNKDHGATGQDSPASGTSPEDQRRARAGEGAKARADQNRLANQRELERDPIGILSATVHGFGAPVAAESGRRAVKYYQARTTPEMKNFKATFNTVNEQIANETKQLARATRGTIEYERLESRVNAYKKLRLGQTKSATQTEIAADEMRKIEGGEVKGFSSEAEIAHMKNLYGQDHSFNLAKKDALEGLTQDRLAGAGRIARGMFGAGTAYFGSNYLSSITGDGEASEFFKPSTLEITAVGATSTLPVPNYFQNLFKANEPGAPWYLRLGARATYEVAVDLSSKTAAYIYHKTTDPDVEKRHVASAQQAQAADHQNHTSNSMNNAIDAWKVLGNHDNQIQQAIDEAGSQLGTTDPAKLAQTRRDLAALYTAFGETRLDKGTKVGGPDGQGNFMAGPTKQHYLFEGTDYDFGGVAMRNLNTARNALNEVGIPGSDPVAKRVYASLTHSDMSRILNPHSDLPKIYNQLKDMVKKNDPDAQWLSSWLTTRAADQKRMLASEESAVMTAKKNGTPFVPQFNNYVLAKVYQDQALLNMAYAANGKDAAAHLQAAHDQLKEAQRLGWDGRIIHVDGQQQRRQSDLPKLVDMYRNLGGAVDW